MPVVSGVRHSQAALEFLYSESKEDMGGSCFGMFLNLYSSFVISLSVHFYPFNKVYKREYVRCYFPVSHREGVCQLFLFFKLFFKLEIVD